MVENLPYSYYTSLQYGSQSCTTVRWEIFVVRIVTNSTKCKHLSHEFCCGNKHVYFGHAHCCTTHGSVSLIQPRDRLPDSKCSPWTEILLCRSCCFVQKPLWENPCNLKKEEENRFLAVCQLSGSALSRCFFSILGVFLVRIKLKDE